MSAHHVRRVQLRFDLEDDSVAIAAALFRRTVEISVFVKYRATEGELAVAAAGEDVKRGVRPGDARMCHLVNRPCVISAVAVCRGVNIT